jgi:hypothetical protein
MTGTEIAVRAAHAIERLPRRPTTRLRANLVAGSSLEAVPLL